MSTSETTIDNPPVRYQCECLPKIREMLSKRLGKEIGLKLEQFLDFSDEDAQEPTRIMSLPPLFAFWREGRKEKKTHVPFSFCPFCGEKLK